MTRRASLVALCLLVLSAFAAASKPAVNLTSKGLALEGYDAGA